MLNATQLRQPEALRHSLIGSEKAVLPLGNSPVLYPVLQSSASVCPLKICIIYGFFAVTLDKIESPEWQLLLAVNDKCGEGGRCGKTPQICMQFYDNIIS